MAIVSIPLRASLKEFVREARIQRAVASAAKVYQQPGRSFVVRREVNIGTTQTSVILDLATTSWYSDSVRIEFEQKATENAGEPVVLTLEQLPATSGDLSQLANLIGSTQDARPMSAHHQPGVAAGIHDLQTEIAGAVSAVPLPDSFTVLGSDITIGDSTTSPTVNLTYMSPAPLSNQARQIIEHHLANELGLPGVKIIDHPVIDVPRLVNSASSPVVDSLAGLLGWYPQLSIEMTPAFRTPGALTAALNARLPRVILRPAADTLSSQYRKSRAITLRLILR
ncbi:MAG: hypothetical protein ACRD3J_07535 [Thermoanaerobaculia bacterium]